MPLYPIDECPDLLVDACVCDEERRLIFLSAWGRDTAVQEFLARLTLGRSEGGLEQFHLVQSGHSLPVFPDAERLEKRTTRQLRGTLFGSLLHVWLFDGRCAVPDRANHLAYALVRDNIDPLASLWPLVVDTCPLPLLPHWQGSVMELLLQEQMLERLPGALGDLAGWRLRLKLDELQYHLGQRIRAGQLTTS